jgi:hypothetical protein
MLDGGHVIASGPVEDLVRRHGSPVLAVTLSRPLPQPLHVAGCTVTATVDGLKLRISSEAPQPPMPQVLAALGEYADRVQSIEVHRPSLELVYQRLRRSSRFEASVPLVSPVVSPG